MQIISSGLWEDMMTTKRSVPWCQLLINISISLFQNVTLNVHPHVHPICIKFHILMCKVHKLLQWKPAVRKYITQVTTTLFVNMMKNRTQSWFMFRTYSISKAMYWLALRLPCPQFHATVPFGSYVINAAKCHYQIVTHCDMSYKMNIDLLTVSFASIVFQLQSWYSQYSKMLIKTSLQYVHQRLWMNMMLKCSQMSIHPLVVPFKVYLMHCAPSWDARYSRNSLPFLELKGLTLCS